MSRPDRIPPPLPGPVEPNLRDYAEARRSFSWAGARSTLAGLPGGRGLNIAHEAVDRHVLEGHAEQVALRWRGKGGERRNLTYRELAQTSNRWANTLVRLGVRPGDRVVTLLGRVPELYIIALGTWKLGAIYCPLFAAFGPEPVRTRLEKSGARVLVTTAALFSRKVLPGRAFLPALEHVFLIDDTPSLPGVEPFGPAIEAASAEFTIPPTDPENPALLHFTSGTTGTPKGAITSRGGGGPSHHRQARARPASGRHLLVHGRSRLGHRDVLRHHRAADQRGHSIVDEGGLRCRALVSSCCEQSG